MCTNRLQLINIIQANDSIVNYIKQIDAKFKL